MRLTLRTLLAYLDNVLDPADAEELGGKIKESEFATGLKQRIQSIVTKPRMGAPKLDAKGLTGDANNVAEYLDSSLPPDRVGDFERVCLESDVTLAEAAACHQILTLVLGKPAEVPVGLRERVYALNLEPTVAVAAATSATAAPAGQTKPPPVPPPTEAELPKPPPVKPPLEVPDYLRSGRRRSLWPLVATIAAILLLAVAGLRAMGPFDGTHPVLGGIFGGRQIAQGPDQDAENAPPVVLPDETNPGGETADNADVPPPVVDDVPPATLDREPVIVPAIPDEAMADEGEMPPDVPATLRPVPVDGDGPAVPPVDRVPPIADARPVSPDNLPNDPAVTGLASPQPPVPGDTEAMPEDAPAVAAGGEVGRFVSDDQVLARFDGTNRLWLRVPPRTLVAPGERLVALPTYRPQISLASGVQLTLVGESAIVLAPANENRAVVLVDYGRLLFETVGMAGAQIELNLTGLKGIATLSDADSSLAIEVRPYLPPGTDPEDPDTPAIPVVDLFATRGRVIWQEEGRDPVEIPGKFGHTYVGNAMPTTNGPFKAPDWTDPRSLSSLDRDTSLALEELLSVDKPLSVALQEQLQDRRVDIRALAARGLVALDQFEPIVKELSDNRQYSFWTAELDSLREALARGPEAAAGIRQAITNLRPEVDKELYRLLWGFSPEQLARGDAEMLVKNLESPDMDIRVLTFDNLRRITGVLLLYRPERKVDQNKLAIQKWRDKLKDGSIVYKVQPTALPERKPLERMPAGE